MNLPQAIFLGIVQGLTEFIPVSSSGHLELIPKIFGWQEPSTTFITFLHFGTLLSLLIFYRKLILKYLISLYKILIKRNSIEKEDSKNLNVIRNIVVATIPAAILGLLLEKIISDFYDSSENSITAGVITAVALILVGTVFLFANRFFKNKKVDIEKLSSRMSLIIGVSQVFAFLRGVSRSGITLIAGQLVGLKRVAAAEFGFLMSIPIITATSLYGTYNLLKMPSEQLSSELIPALAGFVFSFVFGLLAIKFMLDFLKRNGLFSFGIYRIIFGLFVLLVLL